MSRPIEEFGRWCLERMRSPAPGDINGGDAQDEAERLGLLVRVPCTEPCGDSCACAEYHGEGPWDCLRVADSPAGPVASQQTDEDALHAAQDALRESGASSSPSLLDALIRLGRVILELRQQLAAARRERDAVADAMDDDMDALVDDAAREECHGEVPGA